MRFFPVLCISICAAMIFSTEPSLAKTNLAEDGYCKEPKSNLEMTDCASLDFKRLDRDLNQTYQQVIASNKGEAGMIRVAQRAWLAYRDKECAVIAHQWQGGSGQGLAIMSCKNELTKERTHRLRFYYLGEDNQSGEN